jgi:predicted kinase
MVRMTKPTLVVVGGPPGGTGKTTLAHTLAALIGCPAICRDEIKEGMVYTLDGYNPTAGDEVTTNTLKVFFDVIGLLLRSGVTIVAEAAFQDRLWRPNLKPLMSTARIRVIHCASDPKVAQKRVWIRAQDDPNRSAHDEQHRLDAYARGEVHDNSGFRALSLNVPSIVVNTDAEYSPSLDDIVRFIQRE